MSTTLLHFRIQAFKIMAVVNSLLLIMALLLAGWKIPVTTQS